MKLERRKEMDRNIDCILVIARETMNANWRAKGRGIGRYTPTLEHSFRFVEADLFELMMTWNCLLFDEALETINLRYQLFSFREKWIIRFQGISKNIFGTIFHSLFKQHTVNMRLLLIALVRYLFRCTAKYFIEIDFIFFYSINTGI